MSFWKLVMETAERMEEEKTADGRNIKKQSGGNYMKEKQNSASAGVGITGLLQVAFIVLKLCGVINWSWWWVLCPTWIPVGVVLIALVVIVISALIKNL